MYRVLLVFIIFLNIVPVFADYINYSGFGPNYNNFSSKLYMNKPKTEIATYTKGLQQNRWHPHYCPQCSYNNQYLSKKDLNVLEQYALNKSYRRENDLKRLERLENLAFGATQIGDMQTRYRNVENAILSRPKYNTKQSLINNLANYFSGQPTGFTPSLNTYNNYSNFGGFSNNPYLFTPTPNYNNNRFESYSNGIFGGGWGVSGQNFGTGSSVKILD